MVPIKFHIPLSFLLFLFFGINAQETLTESTDKPGFSFKDGIYNSSEEFFKNDPLKPGDYRFLSQLEIEEYVVGQGQAATYYSSGQYIWLGKFDKTGVFTRVMPDSVWAFVTGGEVFVRHGEYLVPLDLIGSVCHFNTGNAMVYRENKPKEYIFRINEGNFMRFTQSNFLSIISEDMELYQLYLKQDGSFKKMKSSMMDFVLKYNERNPYTPPNE